MPTCGVRCGGVALLYRRPHVRVGAGVANDVDVTIRADYEATLPTARLVYTPEILAQRAKAPPAVSP